MKPGRAWPRLHRDPICWIYLLLFFFNIISRRLIGFCSLVFPLSLFLFVLFYLIEGPPPNSDSIAEEDLNFGKGAWPEPTWLFCWIFSAFFFGGGVLPSLILDLAKRKHGDLFFFVCVCAFLFNNKKIRGGDCFLFFLLSSSIAR